MLSLSPLCDASSHRALLCKRACGCQTREKIDKEGRKEIQSFILYNCYMFISHPNSTRTQMNENTQSINTSVKSTEKLDMGF